MPEKNLFTLTGKRGCIVPLEPQEKNTEFHRKLDPLAQVSNNAVEVC